MLCLIHTPVDGFSVTAKWLVISGSGVPGSAGDSASRQTDEGARFGWRARVITPTLARMFKSIFHNHLPEWVALITVTIWGTNFAFQKALLAEITPWAYLWARVSPGCLSSAG